MNGTARNTIIFESAFGKVDEDALDSLRRVAIRRTYPPKTVLCCQGELEHTFYIVNDAGEAHGNGRLQQTLATYGRLPATDLLAAIRSDIKTWMQQTAPVDDITLLLVEVN